MTPTAVESCHAVDKYMTLNHDANGNSGLLQLHLQPVLGRIQEISF